MKKLFLGLLVLTISFSSNAEFDDSQYCYCSEMGWTVESPKYCEGECLPTQKITKQDGDCFCDMHVIEIDGIVHYAGAHACNCRGPEGDLDTLLESMKKEYPPI